MKIVTLLRLSCIVAAAAAMRLPVRADSPLGSKPIELFDGHTLAGWEGDARSWRVEQGAIVGEIPRGSRLKKNTWLIWKGGELRDFDLRLQVKLTGAPSANSGIQFRCQAKDVDHVRGYQADLDQGATWLGRIYDEHGRALLVERGTRVAIAPDGTRAVGTFAPANQFGVLFRLGDWNDYRIIAVGHRISVFVNGTLFSELDDRQEGECDLRGRLALQLHAGPHTRVEFRHIVLEPLDPKRSPLPPIAIDKTTSAQRAVPGRSPQTPAGTDLNLGFELGKLSGWTATGDAFRGQPVDRDGIARRWPGQTSGKIGKYFIGGYEIVGDKGVGTLTSQWFDITAPYGSFLVGGGSLPETRVELRVRPNGDAEPRVLLTARGENREAMRRVAVDLRSVQGQQMSIRLVDESRGGWGHLNFDDFRFHDTRPIFAASGPARRTTANPILHHLKPQRQAVASGGPGSETAQAMWLPEGFAVDVIAAEPRVHQPIAFTFDARGRLWIAEAHSYPQKRPEGQGLDRIVILADNDGDGRFEWRTVFAEGLNLVSGLEVGHGGVWVGAAPELIFLPDRDGDDRPDGDPIVLLDGFGHADTHETLNNFIWGPDGWLYGNQGVFNRSSVGKPGAPDSERVVFGAGVWRYHPTKHRFEVFAHGGSNQWGLDYDERGELFMTHCRSRWGRGATTHVIQGGRYWNQVNRGYAPFVSARPLPGRPWMRHYLLASARYGHGEGGAGRPGSRAVFGGHAHVGTMIYLGDNWPADYRGHLFTHNLHGHQINHQVARPEGGSYWVVHAGRDVLYCSEPSYVAVDLKVGPDGAVYMTDWTDPRHCHNPNVEVWDRSNGRVYRVQYAATYRPVRVDYTRVSDRQLVAAQRHPNAWHARMARLVLSERAAKRAIDADAVRTLVSWASSDEDPVIRLRAIWSLHVIERFDRDMAQRVLRDSSEYVRAWGVRLAVEDLAPPEYTEPIRRLVRRERSVWVQRYLASAMSRVPRSLGWEIAESLGTQAPLAGDRVVPALMWCAMAGWVEHDPERAFRLADTTPIPLLSDAIVWYAAKVSHRTRALVVDRMAEADGPDRPRYLQLVAHAVRDMRGLDAPASWSRVAESLYRSDDAMIRSAAETVGAAFGDASLYRRMRALLAEGKRPSRDKRHALSILSGDASSENLPILLRLLDDRQVIDRVIPMLARYDDARVAQALLDRYSSWPDGRRLEAKEVLCSRVSWCLLLLDRIAAGELPKKELTAYDARQMLNLSNRMLTERLGKEWGVLGTTSSEARRKAIERLVQAYRQAPLWAYSAEAGRTHFEKICAACHDPKEPDDRIAPAITGIRRKGIGYIVENIVDPNAVIGRDFLATIFHLADGRVVTGLVQRQTDSSITIRTATEEVTVARDDIEASKLSEKSFMPEGLLDPLSERQRIELLKYLMSR